MTTTERLGRNGDLYRRFASEAGDRLASGDLTDARGEYERFLRAAHGDVLEGLDVSTDRVFVDALYYEALVDGLTDLVVEATGITLENRGLPAAAPLGEAARARVIDPENIRSKIPPSFRSKIESWTDPTDAGRGSTAKAGPTGPTAAGVDLLRDLYEAVVSRERRLALGEYFTPPGVARLAVEEPSVDDHHTDRFLDPGCGTGAFLAAAIDRKLEAIDGECSPAECVRVVTDTVCGVDLNPVATKAARLAYLLALAPVASEADVDGVEVPVRWGDALGLEGDADASERLPDAVEHLVGNPPWITWSDLADRTKRRWRESFVEELDLFPHEGASARLGHANDDLSVSFALACVHRYLASGGSATFVLKRGLTKGPAGRQFRRLRVDDRSLSSERVHDFGDLRPFEGVDAGVAVYALRADRDGDRRVPVTAWSAGGDRGPSAAFRSLKTLESSLTADETALVPVGDDPGGPWVRADAERSALGGCDHRIRHGLKDDAKAVFSVERERLSDLDRDLVYPYLKSRHVVKYGLFGYDLQLVPLEQAGADNEAHLRSAYPDTYAYLRDHEDRLRDRSSAWLSEGGTFYDLFGLGPYTWADYKVVWCRLGFKPHFAVVSTVEDPDLGETTVVPGDHCMFVATDDRREAHFLCGLLNAAPYQRCLEAVAGDGKATLSKSMVSKLRLPEYPGTDFAERVAELSMAAHRIVPEYTDVGKREYNRTTIPELAAIQAELDELVETALAEDRFAR